MGILVDPAKQDSTKTEISTKEYSVKFVNQDIIRRHRELTIVLNVPLDVTLVLLAPINVNDVPRVNLPTVLVEHRAPTALVGGETIILIKLLASNVVQQNIWTQLELPTAAARLVQKVGIMVLHCSPTASSAPEVNTKIVSVKPGASPVLKVVTKINLVVVMLNADSVLQVPTAIYTRERIQTIVKNVQKEGTLQTQCQQNASIVQKIDTMTWKVQMLSQNVNGASRVLNLSQIVRDAQLVTRANGNLNVKSNVSLARPASQDATDAQKMKVFVVGKWKGFAKGALQVGLRKLLLVGILFVFNVKREKMPS